MVRLALTAEPAVPFLAVDTNLIRLLEMASGRVADDKTRARVLARLARELLGDASAAARRRALADEALTLARAPGDPGVLAEVLDARLHALWDPEGASDRLAAGSEITGLARAFAREATAAGDAEAAVLVTARHAMLAILRGRFEQAIRLTEDVKTSAERAGLADAGLITGTLAGAVVVERG